MMDDQPLPAHYRMPEHVVFRTFVEETVLLNLQTGKYHGLNPTAGRMLELLVERQRPRDVAETIAAESGVAPDVVERDLLVLCRDLVERGLVEVVGA